MSLTPGRPTIGYSELHGDQSGLWGFLVINSSAGVYKVVSRLRSAEETKPPYDLGLETGTAKQPGQRPGRALNAILYPELSP
jgi:hypothetical protein